MLDNAYNHSPYKTHHNVSRTAFHEPLQYLIIYNLQYNLHCGVRFVLLLSCPKCTIDLLRFHDSYILLMVEREGEVGQKDSIITNHTPIDPTTTLTHTHPYRIVLYRLLTIVSRLSWIGVRCYFNVI